MTMTLLSSVTDPCNQAVNAAHAARLLDAIVVLATIAIIAIFVDNYFTRKRALQNPNVETQQERAQELAHEFEETLHECCQTPMFDYRYLDPVVNAFTIGRVSRAQLHDAIGHWMKDGTDYRQEENQFWN